MGVCKSSLEYCIDGKNTADIESMQVPNNVVTDDNPDLSTKVELLQIRAPLFILKIKVEMSKTKLFPY